MTRLGVSSSRAFSVGTLPGMTRDKPNNSSATAMPLTPNVVCNASIENKAVDYYVVRATKGKRLIVDTRVGGDLPDLHPRVKVDFLRHVAEPFLARGAELPSRLAQDADVAALRVLQAQREVEQRRLAGAVLAHEAHDRACRQTQIDFFEHRLVTEAFETPPRRSSIVSLIAAFLKRGSRAASTCSRVRAN